MHRTTLDTNIAKDCKSRTMRTILKTLKISRTKEFQRFLAQNEIYSLAIYIFLLYLNL